MVRTVLCHPFVEHKGFTDQYDASCICCTKDDRALIASLYGSINLIDLKTPDHSVLHKFPSVGVPVKMVFCDKQQFLLSLESKLQDYRAGLSPRDMNCQARVYLNIMIGNTQRSVNSLSSGYSVNRHNNINTTRNKFAMIDLAGLRQPATDIAICSVKSNIAVSSSKKIYLYSYKEVLSEDLPKDDNISTIDFIRMIEVETTINIRCIALNLNWIAFASKTELRVIQVYLHQPSDEKVYQGEDVSELLETEGSTQTSEKLSSSSPVKPTKEETTLWDFDQATSHSSINEFELKGGHGMMEMQSIQEEKPYIDTRTTPKEITGEHVYLVGHPLCCSFLGQMPSKDGHLYYASVTSTTHLYRRFHSEDISFSGNYEKIHSIQWLPIYLEEIPAHKVVETDIKRSWPWNTFTNPLLTQLLTMPLFFSTGTHGYLYDTWNSNGLIVDYSYTSDCLNAIHANSLLYTITTNGIEIFTSRLFPFISAYAKEMFEGCQTSPEDLSIQDIEKPYRARDRGPTQTFLETNYFTEYVSVNNDLSMNDENRTEMMMKKATEMSSVYPVHWLLKKCPPKDLETCLIGMYPYQDILSVSTSMSFVVMFVKAPKRSKDKTTPSSTPWSLSSFEKHVTTDITKRIKQLIVDSEFSNPTVYYHLLCESHFLFCCDVVARPFNEKLIEMIKMSAAEIGTFLSRSESTFDLSPIKDYFEVAGMNPSAVIEHMKNENIRLERKKHKFGMGMIEYLDTILFSNETVNFDKDTCDFVINIYGKNNPSSLSKVILKSNLPRLYSNDLCVKFISKLKRKKEAKNARLQPIDSLCFAFLHMELGNPGHAEELLKELEKADLKKVCVSNPEVLFNKNFQFKPVAQLLRKHFKETFQLVMVSLFDSRNITLQNILTLCQPKEETEMNNVIFHHRDCHILELLLNESSRRKYFPELAAILVDQYILRLTKRMNECEGWRMKHDHEIKGNGHFGARFTWLNSTKPFSGDIPSPQDCVLLKQNQQRRRGGGGGGNQYEQQQNHQVGDTMAASMPTTFMMVNNKSTPSKVLSLSSTDHEAVEETSKRLRQREFCPCCCCSETLMKFQSLLSSRYNRKELSLYVIEKLNDVDFVGKESLLLLTWPKAGISDEAIQVVVANQPSIILQYAKDLFDWKAQWQLLLQHILQYIKDNKFEPWNHDIYMDTLKGVLLRLARAFTPKEFLSMLPHDMNLNFVMPYLAECNEFHSSATLRNNILSTYKREIEVHED